MDTLWQFLLVFSAIGSGWLLGRFASGVPPFSERSAKAYRRYYRGLNHLLNDRTDEAVDDFLKSLDVTVETFETHLALGGLMRRKGDVEGAIRVHENLQARPSLSPQQLQQARLELARDYIAAGLYDRAENLLQELLQHSQELREVCLRHLIEIYQAERDWEKAIETANRLLPRRSLLLRNADPDPQLESVIAQFHCEIAQRLMNKGELLAAGEQLKAARERDNLCARAWTLQSEVDYRAGRHDEAVVALQYLLTHSPGMIAEVLEKLRAAADSAGRRGDLLKFLRDCLQRYPSTRIALAIADEMREQQGIGAAANFLVDQVRARPTLRGLSALLKSGIDDAETGPNTEQILGETLDKLIAAKPQYQCVSCGFSGRQLHWSCPRCKLWNTVQPIRGTEGD
jgi:lipopolysaccharide biosynthesis regulator YciM